MTNTALQDQVPAGRLFQIVFRKSSTAWLNAAGRLFARKWSPGRMVRLARGRLSRRGRAATTGAALLLCVLGYFGAYRSNSIYDRFAVAPGRSAWSANDQFQSRGGIYPFLHSIRAAVPKAPGGYDKREAEALLAEYEDDDKIVKNIPQETLLRFISELPDGYRTVFNLFTFENKSHKEIANLLHINEKSSSSQLHRARTILMNRIKQYWAQYENG